MDHNAASETCLKDSLLSYINLLLPKTSLPPSVPPDEHVIHDLTARGVNSDDAADKPIEPAGTQHEIREDSLAANHVDDPANTSQALNITSSPDGDGRTSEGHDSAVDLEKQLFPSETDPARWSGSSETPHTEDPHRTLLTQIATSARSAIRNGEDKVALAVTMYDWVRPSTYHGS